MRPPISSAISAGIRAVQIPGVQRKRPRDEAPQAGRSVPEDLRQAGANSRLRLRTFQRNDTQAGVRADRRRTQRASRLAGQPAAPLGVHRRCPMPKWYSELYWTALSRPPSDAENSAAAVEMINDSAARPRGCLGRYCLGVVERKRILVPQVMSPIAMNSRSHSSTIDAASWRCRHARSDDAQTDARRRAFDSAQARAKSVIFLFQWGGPSQLDTFDMKPDCAGNGAQPLSADCVQRTGHRSLRIVAGDGKADAPRDADSDDDAHDEESCVGRLLCTQRSRSRRATTSDYATRSTCIPRYGSVVDHLAPNDNGMPTSVAYPHVIRDGSIVPAQHASFLGKRHDPLLFLEDPNDANFQLPELSLPSGLSIDRLAAATRNAEAGRPASQAAGVSPAKREDSTSTTSVRFRC